MNNLIGLKQDLRQAKKDKYIRNYQASVAIKKYRNDGDLSILDTIETNKASRLKANKITQTMWYDLTEADALRAIVRQNNEMIGEQKTIRGLITFLGFVTLASTIIGIYLAMSL